MIKIGLFHFIYLKRAAMYPALKKSPGKAKTEI